MGTLSLGALFKTLNMDNSTVPPQDPGATAVQVNSAQPAVLSDELVKKILVEGHYVTPDVIAKAEAYVATTHIDRKSTRLNSSHRL